MNKISDFLTLVIAIGMFYIAYQQWKTSEKEIRKDLFQQRYNKLYTPLRVCLSLFALYTCGVKTYGQSEDEMMFDQIKKFREHFTNHKHLFPKQLNKLLSKRIDNLCENLQDYTKADTEEQCIETTKNIAKEYLIILHFISDYLFVENNKAMNIYQFIFETFLSTVKFLTPIKIQEKIIEFYYEKQAIKISTYGSTERKEFLTDLLRHGVSL